MVSKESITKLCHFSTLIMQISFAILMGYLRSWCCRWKSLQSQTIRRPSLNLRMDILHAACKPIIPDLSFTILPVKSPPYSCRYVKTTDMYTICASSYNLLFPAPSELITPSTPCSVSLIKMTWEDSCRNSLALTSRYDCVQLSDPSVRGSMAAHASRPLTV